MIGARVVEALVFSKFLLNVGRSLVDGEDDSAGGGIGLLPDVDGIGGKTHNYDLLVSSGSVSTGPETLKPDDVRACLDAEASKFIQIKGRAACRQFAEIPGNGSVSGKARYVESSRSAKSKAASRNQSPEGADMALAYSEA